MSAIFEAVLDGRKQIVAHDRAMLARVIAYYEDVYAQIEQEVRRLEWQIQDAIRSGDFEMSEAWIRRQTWYRELEGSIRERLEGLNRSLGVALDYAQYEAVAIAGDSMAAFQGAIGQPFTGSVNTRAFERWVSATSPGSPLNEVLRKYGLDAEEQLLRRITEGIGRGRGSSSITREIMRSLGGEAEQYKIARIVRTEVMRSYRGASADMYQELPDGLITGYEWVAAHSERTCAACLALDATRYPTYPQKQHPNCFPAGTVVNGPDVLAATKRWYVGDLVEIVTASGERLSVTPNHPILTPNGWVAAGEIVQGDDVIRYVHPKGEFAAINPDYERRPALIEEVTESLMGASTMVTVAMPGTPVDFHGDGSDGEVNIVFADSLLGNGFDSAFSQPLGQHEFVGRHMAHALFSCLCSLYARFIRNGAAPYSVMSGAGESLALLGRCLSHSNVHSLRSSANGNTSFFQMAANDEPLGAKFLGKRLFGLACQISGRNLARRNRELGSLSHSHLAGADRIPFGFGTEQSSVGQEASQGLASGMEHSRGIIDRLTGEIEVDCVVDISRRSFSGHVYNLQTRDEWYISNNIITHNCRCVAIAVVSSTIVPARAYQRRTGSEYFASLPEQKQKLILGGDEALQLYRQGAPLSAWVGERESDDWGITVYQRSTRQVKKAVGAGQ